MSEELNLPETIELLESAHRRLSDIKLPANETASVDRPAMWNRAIRTLKDVALELAENQRRLVDHMRHVGHIIRTRDEDASTDTENVDDVKPTDEAGGQSKNVKSADKAGGNGGETVKT